MATLYLRSCRSLGGIERAHDTKTCFFVTENEEEKHIQIFQTRYSLNLLRRRVLKNNGPHTQGIFFETFSGILRYIYPAVIPSANDYLQSGMRLALI